MSSIAIFDTIFEAAVQYLGFSWLFYIAIGIGIFILSMLLIQTNAVMALVLAFLPISVAAIMLAINVSWLLAVVVLVLGSILAISIWKLVS